MRQNYIDLNVKGTLEVKTKKDIAKIRTLLNESNLENFEICKLDFDDAIEANEYDFKLLTRDVNRAFWLIEFLRYDIGGGYLDETIIEYNEIHRKMARIIEDNAVNKFIIVSRDEMESAYKIMSKHYGANAFTEAVDKAASKHIGYNLDDLSDILNKVMQWDSVEEKYNKEQYNDKDAECFDELSNVL